MATLTGVATIAVNDLYTSDTTIPGGLVLGQLAVDAGGRFFRYALAGASNLVVGNLLQEAAEDTQFENMAVLASSIATAGALQTVQVTNGTTTVNAHDFDGGSLVVYTTPDLGREYTILSHTTGTSGATLTLTLDRPLQNAWTTSTKVTMKRSPWAGVIQFPTTQTGMPVGVAVYALPSASYGWVQSHGSASVLSDNSTFAVGSAVGTSLATAGAVGVNVAGTTHTTVGVARQANASGHNVSVFLQID